MGRLTYLSHADAGINISHAATAYEHDVSVSGANTYLCTTKVIGS